MDIQDCASIEKAVERVQAAFGHLDILINNAGVLEEPAPIADSMSKLLCDSCYINLPMQVIPMFGGVPGKQFVHFLPLVV